MYWESLFEFITSVTKISIPSSIVCYYFTWYTYFCNGRYHDPEGLKGKVIICLLTTYFIKVHSFKVGTIHTLFFRSTLVVMHIMLVACLAALVVGSSHLGLHPQSIFICIFFSFFFFFLFFSFSFNVGIR